MYNMKKEKSETRRKDVIKKTPSPLRGEGEQATMNMLFCRRGTKEHA